MGSVGGIFRTAGIITRMTPRSVIVIGVFVVGLGLTNIHHHMIFAFSRLRITCLSGQHNLKLQVLNCLPTSVVILKYDI